MPPPSPDLVLANKNRTANSAAIQQVLTSDARERRASTAGRNSASVARRKQRRSSGIQTGGSPHTQAAHRLAQKRRDWRSVYLQFDRDLDGTVSVPNLRRGLKRLGLSLTNDQVDAVADAADELRSGQVSFAGFVRAVEGTQVWQASLPSFPPLLSLL